MSYNTDEYGSGPTGVLGSGDVGPTQPLTAGGLPQPVHPPESQPGGWQWGGEAGGAARTEVLYTQTPSAFAFLVVTEGPGTGQIMRLNPLEGNTIGRDYSCDIVIDEPAVSRQHAKIRTEKDEEGELRFFIQDLATENGTMVNDEQIIKTYLTDGDRIKLARVLMVFKQV